MYNSLTLNGTKEINAQELKHKLINERSSLQLDDSIGVLSVSLTQIQIGYVKDHFRFLVAIQSMEDFISYIYRASLNEHLTWENQTLEDLYMLFQELQDKRTELTVDEVMFYIDIYEPEQFYTLENNSSNALEKIIPSTLTNLKIDFRKFVKDTELIISGDTSENTRSWFKDLLKFGDRLVEHVK